MLWKEKQRTRNIYAQFYNENQHISLSNNIENFLKINRRKNQTFFHLTTT